MKTWWRRLGALIGAIANWRFFKPAVFVACAVPLVLLSVAFSRYLFFGQESALGIDPVKTLEHETGEDALGLVVIGLCITPVRRLFSVNRVQIVRRMVGVWAFTYAVAHVLVYLAFDRNCVSLATCQYGEIWTDLVKRKFIFVGMLAFTLLLLLAITSTKGWMRRLKKKWTTLHRFVYVAAIAGVVHYVWGQKSDISEPLKWAGYVVVLLGIRVYFSWRKAIGPSPKAPANPRVLAS
jgi:sulfoxide reductase heme-binding subunit YedZ